MSEWQPIETAPKQVRLIVYLPGSYEGLIITAWKDESGSWHREGFLRSQPTHWMPLPDPPEAD